MQVHDFVNAQPSEISSYINNVNVFRQNQRVFTNGDEQICYGQNSCVFTYGEELIRSGRTKWFAYNNGLLHPGRTWGFTIKYKSCISRTWGFTINDKLYTYVVELGGLPPKEKYTNICAYIYIYVHLFKQNLWVCLQMTQSYIGQNSCLPKKITCLGIFITLRLHG